MPAVEFVVPEKGHGGLASVLSGLESSPVEQPFAQNRIDFVAAFSRALSRAGRGLPEIQALAFWIRKAALNRLRNDFSNLWDEKLISMPRGTVFHVPPANVDTLFVYSLVLSLLVGNRNIVRLSARTSEQTSLIIETLRQVLELHPKVARTICMLRYGYDQSITQEISSQCDVRVIWGGDATVRTIRQTSLPPQATELTFPDRFSMAALKGSAYAELNENGRDQLVEKFYNDSYWFDQLGCSSARLILWVGSADSSVQATDFWQRLMRVIEAKGYSVDTSSAIAKLGQSLQSVVEGGAETYSAFANTLTVIKVSQFPEVRGEFCGGGLFYQLSMESLLDLVPHVKRSDQTLASFGFSAQEVGQLVSELKGRGIDRIVPFGKALEFDRVWDGYDLLQEFTRRVSIDVEN